MQCSVERRLLHSTPGSGQEEVYCAGSSSELGMVRGEWWQVGWTRRRLSVCRLQRQCMTILMLANKVLVEQGADLDRRDGEGWTTLWRGSKVMRRNSLSGALFVLW